MRRIALLCFVGFPACILGQRPRARDAGVVIGVFQPGPLNAITDVAGVRVGHTTVVQGDSIHTGVTAILPHGGNLFRDRVPAALFVFNGFGKLLGSTQLQEHGELETPILLTCTLCVWKAADAMVAYLLAQSDMGDVRSINPVVGETNDGGLSDIRSRPISEADVRAALENAKDGPVAEGSVGAGAGTQALGWKGGIGTSSRRLPAKYGSYTVGVLVQSNYGGNLTINGAPVGRELGRYEFQDVHGSCMMIVATDAPLTSRDLERVAKRAILGLARTGSDGGPGSGDYVIAFSTAASVRRHAGVSTYTSEQLRHDDLGPVFEATAEATEEALINSLFRATDVTYRGHTTEALPIDRTLAILNKYHARS
ncbi:MAG TPA: P1 family peptidase [Gemmatimonadaceae bacterium]|nr:P1 family peptidase [Gemmatimonadaceae bacterium]